jgi:hypothetical protein
VAVGGESPCHADEGKVIAFRPAGGEDDLIAIDAQKGGNLVASVVHRFLGSSSDGVMAGRMTEVLGQEGKHGFLNGRSDGGGRVVVEIDRSHLCQRKNTRPRARGSQSASQAPERVA